MSTEYPLLDLQSIPSRVSSVDRASFFAEITPKTANKILEELNYDRQRPENSTKRVQLLAAMKDGSFEPISTLMFCVKNDQTIHLVNGQHTLAAMVGGNHTYVLPLQIYRENPEKLYPKIDRGKPRNLKDAVRSNRTAISMNMSETATVYIARGVKVILNDYYIIFRGIIPISEDIILSTTVEKYKNPAKRFFGIIDGLEYGRKLTGQVPMSLFLTLYEKIQNENLDKVDNFVYGCASGIGLKEGDPRRLVYSMYAERTRHSNTSTRKRGINKTDELAILLGCWENWYYDRLRMKRYGYKDLTNILSKSPNVSGTNITFQSSMRKN